MKLNPMIQISLLSNEEFKEIIFEDKLNYVMPFLIKEG